MIKVQAIDAIWAPQIWPLIQKIAKNELLFPEISEATFAPRLTTERVLKVNEENNAAQYMVIENQQLAGVLIGTASEGGVATILWLIVAPNFRRQGIGEALFMAAEAFYLNQQVHKLKLSAPSENAVKFYTQLGLKVEGFHPNHWWNLDFWSLGKNLNNH